MCNRFLIFLLSFYFSAIIPNIYAQNDDYSRFLERKTKRFLLASPERLDVLQPPRVVKSLEIKSGMSILDIGAGRGLFTFLFADALKGTGEVFATEIDPGDIKYIMNKAEEGKYTNVFPVLVRPAGLDPFYRQHSFDIIFLCEAYSYIIKHYPDYFRELRPSLKKGRGRLYIVHPDPPDVFRFHKVEFGNFKKVIKIIQSAGEDFPLFQRLDSETKQFFKNYKGSVVPDAIRAKIIQNLNKMLSDQSLFNDSMAYYASKQKPGRAVVLEDFLNPLDVPLAKWLIVKLDQKETLAKNTGDINIVEKHDLVALNRILLTRILNSKIRDCFQGRSSTFAINIIKKAGYQFVREHKLLRFYYILEFKREF